MATGCAHSRRAPLTGFLNPSAVSATPSSTALFRAAAVPELLPTELSPRKDRAPLSRPLAPLRSSTRRTKDAPLGPYRLRFLRRPRPRRSSQDPPQTMDSLSARPEDPASRSPWVTTDGVAPARQLHPLRSFTPSANPFASTQVALRRRPLLSWASAPPATKPTKPRSLEPARARRPEHDPRPEAEASDPGDQQPPDPGET